MKQLLIASVALLACSAGGAEARIKCNENYQVVQGNEISTPYCRDNYLAAVARAYGMRVSDAEIRNNPGRKSDVCRLIGNDIRVQTACAEVDSRRRRN